MALNGQLLFSQGVYLSPFAGESLLWCLVGSVLRVCLDFVHVQTLSSNTVEQIYQQAAAVVRREGEAFKHTSPSAPEPLTGQIDLKSVPILHLNKPESSLGCKCQFYFSNHSVR